MNIKYEFHCGTFVDSTLSEKKSSFGLKRLRAVNKHKPDHSCQNCGCMRYSTCTCERQKP